VLNCAHEKEIIQSEDERERAAHEDVLQRSAPAVEIQAVHLHSLHAQAGRGIASLANTDVAKMDAPSNAGGRQLIENQ
jgi:hypothetical protein